MGLRTLCILAAFALAKPVPPLPSPEIPPDIRQIQGKWEASEVRSGNRFIKGMLAQTKMAFEGDKITMTLGTSIQSTVSFKLNVSKKPKEIDFASPTGELNRGIYQLDGDRLLLCLGTQDGKERPKDFGEENSDAYIKVTMQRVKK